MKKPFRWFILLICIFIIYQFIVLLFVNEHTISYERTTNKMTFKVLEKFNIKNNSHLYSFEITDSKKRKYHVQAYQDYNKQKEVLEKIEFFEDKELACLYPVLKENRPSEIICQRKKKEISYTALLEEENAFIKKVLNQLDQKGYQNAAWNLENVSKKKKELVYYPKNIFANEAFSFWNYQGVYLITNKKLTEKKLFSIDKYENNQSVLVDDSLLVIDSDQSYDFNQLYFICLFDGNKETITTKEKISQDSYFLGSIEGKAYLLDRKNKKEYQIDPKKKEVTIVGNTSLNATYYDGYKWTTRNIYDFIKEDIYFESPLPKNLKKKYPTYQLYRGIGRTYLWKDNEISMVSDSYPDKKVLLFKMDGIKEVEVKENQLFFVSQDTLYNYSTQKGLRPILSTRELEFNPENRYSVAFKH